MLTFLIWRCPLCGTDDSLTHKAPWFRTEALHCSACNAKWAIRLRNDEYYLKVTAGDSEHLGMDLPLPEWHDRMLAGLKLVPVAADLDMLNPGEEVYTRANDVELIVVDSNPLLTSWNKREAPKGLKSRHAYTPNWESVGLGRLYFTDQRLVWVGKDKRLDFWWPSVNGAFIFLGGIFGIMYGLTTYRFRFTNQSPLKWIAYSKALAPRIQEQFGHAINIPVG